ncbi:unnamed protein product [Sphagnum jensenii]|uniref:Uncharacterized protein n=1 Tax=Sphagnum jensenii TaxID=128206 RepID=A0ABP1BEJ8_9BRYO
MLNRVRSFAAGLVCNDRGASYGKHTSSHEPENSECSFSPSYQYYSDVVSGFMGKTPSNKKVVDRPFHTLVDDATAALKSRPGSTHQDLMNFLENKYHGTIPGKVKKCLGQRLKKEIKQSQEELKAVTLTAKLEPAGMQQTQRGRPRIYAKGGGSSSVTKPTVSKPSGRRRAAQRNKRRRLEPDLEQTNEDDNDHTQAKKTRKSK